MAQPTTPHGQTMPPNTPESNRTVLVEVGLKPTQQRIAILGALKAADDHLTAEALYENLKPSQPSLSLATVYRTLDLLVENGLIKRVPYGQTGMRFDANMTCHHHLICKETNQILDYNSQELNSMLNQFFEQNPIPGFNINDFQLNISGRIKTKASSKGH